MIIALDYDHTYTAHPTFWNAVIAIAQVAKIEIIVVTMRYDHEVILPIKTCMIYYTGRMAKKRFLLKFGIKPDIWIDDQPEFIFDNAADYKGEA